MSMPQPAQQPGIWQRIEYSFENHKAAWSISIAAVGIFVAIWLWNRSSSTNNAVVGNPTDSGQPLNAGGLQQQSADYNSILQAEEGNATLLAQLQSAINNLAGKFPTSGGSGTSTGSPAFAPDVNVGVQVSGIGLPKGTSYHVKPGDTIATVAQHLGLTVTQLEHAPGAWTGVNSYYQFHNQPFEWVPHTNETFIIK